MIRKITSFFIAIVTFLTVGTSADLDPEGKTDYVIDFILCSPGFHVSEYRTVTESINGRFVSDHFPIYADITFPE